MRLLASLVEWLRRRKPAADDGPRIIRNGERGERRRAVDQLEELLRIGEAGAIEPHCRTKPTSARRIRSRIR
jgi:hypothetical protein